MFEVTSAWKSSFPGVHTDAGTLFDLPPSSLLEEEGVRQVLRRGMSGLRRNSPWVLCVPVRVSMSGDEPQGNTGYDQQIRTVSQPPSPAKMMSCQRLL
jgi:hypothetical protein